MLMDTTHELKSRWAMRYGVTVLFMPLGVVTLGALMDASALSLLIVMFALPFLSIGAAIYCMVIARRLMRAGGSRVHKIRVGLGFGACLVGGAYYWWLIGADAITYLKGGG